MGHRVRGSVSEQKLAVWKRKIARFERKKSEKSKELTEFNRYLNNKIGELTSEKIKKWGEPVQIERVTKSWIDQNYFLKP